MPANLSFNAVLSTRRGAFAALFGRDRGGIGAPNPVEIGPGASHRDQVFRQEAPRLRMSFQAANSISISTRARPMRKPIYWARSLSGRPRITSKA